MHFSVFRGVFIFLSVIFLISCNQKSNDSELSAVLSPFDSEIQLELVHEWTLNNPERFPNLTYFQFTGDGDLVVGDNSLAKLYLIDKAGNILKTKGGKGRGPGELNPFFTLATHPDGLIATADITNRIINVFNTNDERILTTDFEPGWNTSLQWVDGKLIIINNPFGVSRRNIPSGSKVIRAFDPDSETIEELMILELEMQNEPAEQISCTFCPIVFADEHQFFTTKNDTSYQYHKVDVRTGEFELFTINGLSEAVAFTESEHETMRENRRRASEQAGLEMPARDLPSHKNRFVKLFTDAEKRVWLQITVHQDSARYFDVFSYTGTYLGSVQFPENAESATFLSENSILFRFESDNPDIYTLKLYSF